MARRSWRQLPGGGFVEITPDSSQVRESVGPAILPDMPGFISPIDGKPVEGRKQFREHNRIHDVIPNADLQGLPVQKAAGNETEKIRQSRKSLIGDVVKAVDQHTRKH